jgi:fibronectin type 3 domain-containing protein
MKSNRRIGGACQLFEMSTMEARVLLSGVPVLNSLPGAAVSLYLDFNGHSEAQWGSYSNANTPEFNLDGTAGFSQAETDAMTKIWQYVAEDYSPFKINVTTVEPPSFADGVAMRIAIGGNGAWAGGNEGGVSYVNSFTGTNISNVAWVFSDNLGGSARAIGDAVSHESGHTFGLTHQSQWVNGVKTQEYYAGPGDGTAPIMGNSAGAARSLWWNGTSTASSEIIQDDMAVLSRVANNFGYRDDDNGNIAGAATPLTVNGNQLSADGIIERNGDVDFFSFTTQAGQASFTLSVPAGVNNLDAKLELYSDDGTTLIASSSPADSFGAAITTSLAAGSYRVAISSTGGYGNVGQYSLNGAVTTPTIGLDAPSGLTANSSGAGPVKLAWTDNATVETGYTVLRRTDSTAFASVATLDPDSIGWSDSNVAAGTKYYYQVQAFSATDVSGFSSTATATIAPAAPAALTASAPNSNLINLFWSQVFGESGYKIQRSATGLNGSWSQIATVAADQTSWANINLLANSTWFYRVQSFNAGGNSGFSPVASATTLVAEIVTVPNAPTNLNVTLANKKENDLTWTDNSENELGFQIERKVDNGNWLALVQVGLNVTKFSDLAVLPNKAYSYRVRATNAAGPSSWAVQNLAATRKTPVKTTATLAATPTVSSDVLLGSFSSKTQNSLFV